MSNRLKNNIAVLHKIHHWSRSNQKHKRDNTMHINSILIYLRNTHYKAGIINFSCHHVFFYNEEKENDDTNDIWNYRALILYASDFKYWTLSKTHTLELYWWLRMINGHCEWALHLKWEAVWHMYIWISLWYLRYIHIDVLDIYSELVWVGTSVIHKKPRNYQFWNIDSWLFYMVIAK